jgi:hypothetical protein
MNFKSIGIFGLCPIAVLPHLKHNELRTYIALSSFQGNHDSAFPGLDLVANRAGILKSEASKAISSLVKAGYVTRVRRYGKSNIYQVKLPIMDESSYLETPGDGHLENPDDSHLENPDNIIKNHFKTTNLKIKEYSKKQNLEETSNYFRNINKDSSNKVVSNKTKEQRSEESGIAENHPSHAVEIGQISSTINLDRILEAEVSKGSREPSKASKNGSKAKIAKSVIQSFYEYYKKLNDSFEQHTTWDARETKTLRDELLKAALPVDRLLEWKQDWLNKSNPYYKIL